MSIFNVPSPLSLAGDCRFPLNADLSGPGAIISFALLDVTAFFLLTFWLYFRQRCTDRADGIKLAMYGLNVAQLVLTILLLAIGFIQRDDLDWFHLRYILDVAALSVWQTIFTSVTTPQYFWKYILIGPGILTTMVMIPLLGHVYKAKLQASLEKLPQCYDRSHLDVCVPIGWTIYGLLLVFLSFTAALNTYESKSTTKWGWILRLSAWPAWGILAFMTVPIIFLILEVSWMFLDDNAFRPLLDPAEAKWELGQIVVFGTSLSSSALAFFFAFEVNHTIISFISSTFKKVRGRQSRNANPLLPVNNQSSSSNTNIRLTASPPNAYYPQAPSTPK